MLKRTSALLVLPLGLLACSSVHEPGSSGNRIHAAAPRPHTTAMTQVFGPADLGDPLPDAAGAHLALSLRRHDDDGLLALLRDQQNPASPRFHTWLTPAQYGERFGLPQAAYTRILDWLRAAGFEVTAYPNRLFVDASGTVAQVRALLGVQLRTANHNGKTFRSYESDLTLPDDIAPNVVKIGGLDTRVRLHHRMNVNWYGSPTQALDANDLRTLYDIPTGDVGAEGLTLAVLATEEGTAANPNDAGEDAGLSGPQFLPDQTAIEDYFSSGGATATYNPISLPNTDDDYDTPGSNSEYQLDVEMQSVGAPNAKDIDLVMSPASVVFQTGAQYIVNSLSQAVVVSTSIGLCESEEVGYEGGAATDPTSDAYIMRQAVQQGLAEGQTWFAASGDSGADDCYDDDSGTMNGFGGGNATVDFPCSAPEVLCVGGTMFSGPGDWSSSGALTGYYPEVVCNEGADGVAGGGGQSNLFKKPTYQTGVGPDQNDGTRDLPDISLIAATGTPGVIDYDCGQGQDACGDAGTGIPLLDITGGTSVASPLAAGIFAHLAGSVGCRQGDIHQTIYTLGAAQQTNPEAPQPFHDITTGNNDWVDPQQKTIKGFSAGPGYDLATGWGSIDVKELIAAWPSCSVTDGGALNRQDAAPPADAGHDATVGGNSGDGGGGSGGGGSGAGGNGGGGQGGGGNGGGGQGGGGNGGGGGRPSGVDAGVNPPPDNGDELSVNGGCSAAGTTPSGDWLAGVALVGLVAGRRRRARPSRRR